MKILLIIVEFIFIMLIPFIVWFLYFRFYKHIKPTGNINTVKKPNFLKRLFIDFPKRFVYDRLTINRETFTDTGLHLVTGEQGSGKTITVVYLLLQAQKKYPRLTVRTNMGYKFENGKIRSWQDLIFKNNSIYGEIDVLDEIQNWFNSLESKDFPVEMIQEITQQRKQRKQILATSQVWQRVGKPIREQVTILYKPITIFGCLTIVRKYKPVVKNDGDIDKLLYRGMFFFVHDEELRNAFDTYNKIKFMSLKGYKNAVERSAQACAFPSGSASVDTTVFDLKSCPPV